MTRVAETVSPQDGRREHRTRLWRARHVVTHVINPFNKVFASRLPWFGILTHVGRRSGTLYRTPINLFERGDRVVFMLTYGSDAEWVQNVFAAGRCEVSTRGRELHLIEPELVVDPTRRLVPPAVRLVGRLVGVTEFLRMRKSASGALESR